MFSLPLSKCLENERIKQQQVADLSAAVAATVAASVAGVSGLEEQDLATANLSRKSSRTGSRTSFCSLAEGAKQVSTMTNIYSVTNK